MDHFTVTLPSNDHSVDDNTIGSFQVSLPRSIVLEGSWEVGVQGISYTKSWFNITEESRIKIIRDDGTIYFSTKSIKAGCYPNEDSVIKAITYCLDTMYTYFRKAKTVLPSIEFNSITRRVTVSSGRTEGYNLFLELSEELSEILD